jgi:protein-disulfide isomerase
VLAVIAIAGAALLFTYISGANEPSGGVSIAGTTDTELPFETGRTENGFYYKGSTDAPVQVVEYADYQCPACANFATSSLYDNVTSNYVEAGQVHYVFHDFPLQMHPNAPVASQAAYCSGDQDQYWAMHEEIFRTQAQWSSLTNSAAARFFAGLAEDLGQNRATFEACLAEGTYQEHVQAAYQSSVQNGIQATPTFVVDGRSVTAPELLQAIEAALAGEGDS